ncbi:hypothetical protein QZH41_019275 [Actinostola sp. cb2023]|nr:hypothetical protein QZH41_019275 [Actinostola sp. cb2023]
MIMKKPMETGLLMKLVHPEQEARQNPQWRQGIQAKVTALLQILAREVQKDISSHVIPQTVAELVSHLRLCDTAALEQFLQAALKQQNEKVRELCIDALSLAGTTAFVQLVNKIQKEKRTSEIPLALFNRILVNIVFIPEVTPQHVNTVLNLCLNAPEFQPQAQLAIRRQCYLSFGALVNRLSQRPDAQQRTDIQTCIRTAITILTKKLQQAQNADEKLCFIKAIGNAGQPNAALQKILLQHLQNPNHPMVVRVECVWAFRRMVGPQRRDNLCNKLIGIFHDRRQHPELRMAIVELMLDRQPSFFNMQMFLNAAIREMQCQGPRSKQVASWVISKLSSMAYYNNVILQERARRARRALSSARRYVSRTAFGLEYSKAMRIAMYSEKLMSGFEMEMNKMNVPQSYIPRNMNARLMTHLMGHQFEVIQEKPKQPMQPMQPEVSVFMKVFNQEIQFVRITPATINQLVKQITQLLMGQKDEIQTAFGAITITKNSINIHQRFTKAFLAAHARQLEPTITGMPLHHHIISCLVTHVEATINIQAQPSLWKIFNAKSLTASVNARPKISVFTRGFIEVHTPFVRAGIKLQNVIQMKPIINLRLDAQTGISYTFKADVPTQKTDILVISPDPTKPEAVGVCGIVKTTTLRQFNIVPKEIPLTVSTQYMMQVDQMCYGQNLAGVAACAGGRLPSLSTLRFSDVPVFPFIAQTNVRVQIVPQDAVKQIQVQVNVDKQNRFQGDIIFKANGKTKREMTVRYTYALQLNRLVFNVKQITGLPSYLQARLTLNFNSLRNIDATLNQGQYQWKMTSTIDKSGRQITVQFNWNQTLVVVKHDLTLMVNNKVLKQNVFQQQGLKIVKEQQSVVVTLNSMHFLQIQYQPENIQILASPSLRNQLRGLCGDNNGEDFQELRSPNNKILTQTAGFVKSWRTQC